MANTTVESHSDSMSNVHLSITRSQWNASQKSINVLVENIDNNIIDNPTLIENILTINRNIFSTNETDPDTKTLAILDNLTIKEFDIMMDEINDDVEINHDVKNDSIENETKQQNDPNFEKLVWLFLVHLYLLCDFALFFGACLQSVLYVFFDCNFYLSLLIITLTIIMYQMKLKII